MADTLFLASPRGLPAYTFTRTTTEDTYIDADGILQTVSAANELRVGYVDLDDDGTRETPGILISSGHTNLVSDDDVNNWSSLGVTNVTSSITDPAGGTGAYTIDSDGLSSTQGRFDTVTFTGNAAKTVKYVIKEKSMPSSGNQALVLYDNDASTDRLLLNITGWTDGEPDITAATGTLIGKRYIGSGFWEVVGLSTTVTATNVNHVRVYTNAGGSAVGEITVYRVNAYDDANTAPDSILDASDVVGNETLYFDFPYAPQAMTVYVRFVELGLLGGSGTLLRIGSGSNPGLEIDDNGGAYRLLYNDNTGLGASQATLGASPSYDDLVEIRATLNADGTVAIEQSVNSATTTSASSATERTIQPSWSADRLYLGSASGTVHGISQFLDVKVAAGVQTLAAMRSADPFLSLAGVSVPVATGAARKTRTEMGDGGRMWDGTFRRTIRNRVNTWSCETRPLTGYEYETIAAQLESTTQPFQAYGKLVAGTTGDFPKVQTRITGESYVISGNENLPVLEFDMEESS